MGEFVHEFQELELWQREERRACQCTIEMYRDLLEFYMQTKHNQDGVHWSHYFEEPVFVWLLVRNVVNLNYLHKITTNAIISNH